MTDYQDRAETFYQRIQAQYDRNGYANPARVLPIAQEVDHALEPATARGFSPDDTRAFLEVALAAVDRLGCAPADLAKEVSRLVDHIAREHARTLGLTIRGVDPRSRPGPRRWAPIPAHKAAAGPRPSSGHPA